MTFELLIANVKSRLDKNSTTVPDITTPRLKRFMNDRYKQLMRIDGVGAEIRDETYQATATAGSPRLVIPSVMTTISSVVDTTNRIKLVERSLGWIRRQDPSNPAMVTGTPWCYAVLNEAGVIAAPTSTTATIQAVSSVLGDTRLGEMEVQLANGQFDTTSFVLNGTTPVVLTNPGIRQIFRLTMRDTGLPINPVVTISQTAPTALTLLVLGQSDPNTQAIMNQFAKHAWVLHLWPTPSAAITYSIDFARPTYELINDDDEPAYPEDFHNLLIWGACEDECLHMDDSRATYFRGRWDADMKAFRAYLHRSRGQKWVPSGSRSRFSTLGPFFPADWS